MQTRQQDQNLFSQIMSFIGAAGGAAVALSDRNSKTDIKDGWGVLEAVTAKVKPKSFTYKSGERDSGSHVGIMAQDLEQTPLKGAVIQGPDGRKNIDIRHLTTGNTAMISELNQKLDGVISHLKGAK